MATIFGGISVETPKFAVVKDFGAFQIRKYERQLRAEYTYNAPGVSDSLNTPFRTLAGFIFGKNTSPSTQKSESVAMTAPVVTQKPAPVAMTAPVVVQQESGATSSQRHKMSFIMPSKYTLETLPKPLNADIQVVEVPSYTAAAITFSGSMSSQKASQMEQQLRDLCEKNDVKLELDASKVQYCQFNPPWCLPFCRKNEVVIPLIEESQPES